MSDESQCEEISSDFSYIHENERLGENSNDGLSDYEEIYDVIDPDNSDEDKTHIYIDRGMKGNIFVHESDGKVKLEVG